MVARAGGRSSPACGVCVAVRVFFFVAPYCFAAQWTGVSFASVAGCVFALASSCSPQGHQAGKTKFEGGGGGRDERERRGAPPRLSIHLLSTVLTSRLIERNPNIDFFFFSGYCVLLPAVQRTTCFSSCALAHKSREEARVVLALIHLAACDSRQSSVRRCWLPT